MTALNVCLKGRAGCGNLHAAHRWVAYLPVNVTMPRYVSLSTSQMQFSRSALCDQVSIASLPEEGTRATTVRFP